VANADLESLIKNKVLNYLMISVLLFDHRQWRQVDYVVNITSSAPLAIGFCYIDLHLLPPDDYGQLIVRNSYYSYSFCFGFSLEI